MIKSIGLLAGIDLALLATVELQSGLPGAWFTIIHVGLTLFALLLWRRSRSGRGSTGIPAFIAGAALGPVGILAFCFVRYWNWRPRWAGKRKVLPGEPATLGMTQANSPIRTMARMLDGRVSYPSADGVESLATTLQYGSLASRRRALEAIVRSFEPRLSPLIALALTDKDQTIRSLAAAASAQISNEVTQRWTDLASKIARDADIDDTFGPAMNLAGHGCFNVLLPESQRALLCQSAAQYFERHALYLPKTDKRRRQVYATQKMVGEAMARLEYGAKSQRAAVQPPVQPPVAA